MAQEILWKNFLNFLSCVQNLVWVAKGYNAGVRMAKGEYVAIFHDDCQINDPNWIEKCISMLNQEVWAVTPEIRPS